MISISGYGNPLQMQDTVFWPGNFLPDLVFEQGKIYEAESANYLRLSDKTVDKTKDSRAFENFFQGKPVLSLILYLLGSGYCTAVY
jgi:hypothetical protein